MNKLDLITVLGKLLVSKDLRNSFYNDAEALALRLGVNGDEREIFLAIDVEQLEAQAKTLQSKRFHEVRKWLPETIFRLGDKAYGYFIDYSEQYWPEGHNRHVLDAGAFFNYLKQIKVNVCKYEYNRLLFASEHKKISVHFLTCVNIRGKLRSAIQVICKISSKRYEWCLYLGL